jgi:hypothetical protein
MLPAHASPFKVAPAVALAGNGLFGYSKVMFCGALMACTVLRAMRDGFARVLAPVLILSGLLLRLSRPWA